MLPEPPAGDEYFDTPARAERLQLVLHLLRNADRPVYLRGPKGAGKTVFAGRLRTALADEASVAWVDFAEPVKLIAELIRQLGLPPEAADDWPKGLMGNLRDRQLVVVADAVDQADAQTREGLDALGDVGVRLLLVGRGGGADDWDVQFVDLPPFEPDESGEFLRQGAGAAAARITDDLVAASHIAAGGLPGGLLDVLHGLPEQMPTPTPSVRSAEGEEASMGKKWSAPRSPDAEAVMRGKRGAKWRWLGAAALGLLFVAVLVFQDQINAVLTPPEAASGADHQAAEPESPLPTDRAAPPLPLPEPPIALSTPGLDQPVLADDRLVEQPAQDQPVEVEGEVEPPGALDVAASAAAEGEVPAVAPPELNKPVDPVQTAGSPLGAAAGVPPATTVDLADQQSPQAVEPIADPLDVVLDDALSAAAGQPEVAARQPDVASPSDGPSDTGASAPSESAAETVEIEPDSTNTTVAADGEAQTPAVVAETGPAPVEDRSVGAPVKPRQPPAVSASAWLNSREAGRYTLQLVGATDRTSIEKFVENHNISPPFAIFERQLNGRPWYSLIAGDYPDRAAAVAAREHLPASLKNTGIWPRTFASVQASR
jgi:septal ring-binding cell division protein DamX